LRDEGDPPEEDFDSMRTAGMIAAAMALSVGVAGAQTADPLAPGAGADSAKPDAAPAAEKQKPPRPHRAEGGLLPVMVHNDRSVGMVELKVGPAGSPELKKVVGPLAFGRKTLVHLKRVKDCLYDIHAHFADEADTDQSSVDLCKDKNINLTD
jgi:hypothetical protein